MTSLPVKIGFSCLLQTEQVDHALWEIIKEFYFIDSKGNKYIVHKGFRCDLASVPGLLQSIVSKVGYWSQAAVVHDLLYYNHRNGLDTVTTKNDADRILREGCTFRADDWLVPTCERRTRAIYLAVRAAGPYNWETPQEREVRIQEEIFNSQFRDQ